jgi:hypothetical protein
VCEHAFATSQGSAHGRFNRAIQQRQLRNAEDAAQELGRLSLHDARRLILLYGDCGSPKYERAALRWLTRYVVEANPSLQEAAETASALADERG